MSIKPGAKQSIMNEAREYLNSDWHCSEGILKAVGGHYLGEISEQGLRMSTPFAGGIGGTNEGLCGALSGGLMVIGAIHGRKDAQTNDDCCAKLAQTYRDRFIAKFEYSRCADLKKHWITEKGNGSCAELVAQAVGILIDVLEEKA